jgi:hypothetical protein
MTSTQNKKPTLQDLKDAYASTVTLIVPERIKGLRVAAEWFQSMKPFVRSLDRIGGKWYDRGESAYTLGRGGQGKHEQEAAFLGAVRFFERAFSGTSVRIVLYKGYEEKLEGKRARLQTELDKTRAQFAPVLELLTSAFAGFSAVFEVNPNETNGRQMSDNGDIVYGVETAKEMLERVANGEGASVILDELPTVIKANAIQKDALGTVTISSEVILNTLQQAAETLKAFFILPVTERPTGAIKLVPRMVRKRNRIRPITHYRTGTIMERILSRLKKVGDGVTTVEDLFKGIKAADPDRFIRMMVRDGENTGKWKLEKERGGRIVFSLLEE